MWYHMYSSKSPSWKWREAVVLLKSDLRSVEEIANISSRDKVTHGNIYVTVQNRDTIAYNRLFVETQIW